MSKIKRIATGAALAAAVVSGGCGTNPTNQQIGTAGGAVVGGALGNAATGGSTLGTIGGAAVGGVIGNEVGRRRDR
jgi:osmotically inducible lipoprotein OsmB